MAILSSITDAQLLGIMILLLAAFVAMVAVSVAINNRKSYSVDDNDWTSDTGGSAHPYRARH